MDKKDYLQRLAYQLSFYDVDAREIMQNYSEIIDEILDEGLTMEDVVRKLGRPAILAEEIAEEFDLQYTEQVKKQTTLPSWAKAALIISGIIIGGPIIFSIIGTIFGIIFGIFAAIAALIFGGVFAGFSIWDVETLSLSFKLLATFTGLCGIASLSIISYYIINGLVQLTRFIFTQFKKLFNSNSKGAY